MHSKALKQSRAKKYEKVMIATRTAKTCFVYGTLTSQEVLHCLLGRIPPMLPKVVLKKYSRYPVRQQVYPGVIQSTPDAFVEGVLLLDLTEIEVKVLDYFEDEGVDYKRTNVQVFIDSLHEDTQALLAKSNSNDYEMDSKMFKSQAYIWMKGSSTLETTKEWNIEDFQKHLEWYLQYTVKPCRDEAEKFIL